MNLSLPANIDKKVVFESIEKYLNKNNFDIIIKDINRPWGGFFVINEKQADSFIEKYFPSLNKQSISKGGKLSPKILIVHPGKRLSWQYHFRRAELWKVISGEVGVATSETDEESEPKKYNIESIIKLKQGERHRLIGLNTWGVVAEIWQHTDSNHPSNEEDIVRLQDDYGR